MTATDTSIQAYIETEHQRSAQAEVVYNMICEARHPSSSDIARLTGIERTSVCARIRKLEQDGRIYKASTKIDPWTKKTVYWYEPVERRRA